MVLRRESTVGRMHSFIYALAVLACWRIRWNEHGDCLARTLFGDVDLPRLSRTQLDSVYIIRIMIHALLSIVAHRSGVVRKIRTGSCCGWATEHCTVFAGRTASFMWC